jgi:4-amino-4-deoxy-L-arabinose transferase-like glycosyltransferase
VRHSGRYKDTACALVLLLLGLGLRLGYQDASVVSNPVRADAAKYFAAALNLRQWSAYSLEMPGPEAPKTRTDLSPGYPIFLSTFLAPRSTMEAAYVQIRRTQALLGAITVLFTFLLARQSLTLPWAGMAAGFTALSPHLIAIDDYLLTESLFTFLLMSGTLMLAISWRRESRLLALVSGILLALSARVRAIGFLLPIVLAPTLFLPGPLRLVARYRSRVLSVALVVVGALVVFGMHRVFVGLYVTNTDTVQVEPEQFVAWSRPLSYLENAFRPPRFAVEGLSHVLVDHGDRDWKSPTPEGFWNQPGAYLKWNLGGKLLTLWSFDNSYNGDVYIYPMKRKGFEENRLLKIVHSSMRALHWPLFALTLLAPVLWIHRWRSGRLRAEQMALVIPMLAFAYFIGTLLLVSWLPRYSIPVRPLSYVLAAASLSQLTTLALQRGSRGFADANPSSIPG